MSLYTIDHICGHSEEVQIYGTNVHGEREKKAEWLASRPCFDCRKAEELAQAENYEKFRGLSADMAGTEKQVKWARCIRVKRCKEFENGFPDRDEMSDKQKERVKNGIKAFIKFANTKDARFWIDTRDELKRQFFENIKREVLAIFESINNSHS